MLCVPGTRVDAGSRGNSEPDAGLPSVFHACQSGFVDWLLQVSARPALCKLGTDSLKKQRTFDMKPNVLFIIDSFEQGGSERQAMQLLTQLHASGKCRVHLACLQNRGSLRAEADQLGIGDIHEYALNSFYDLNFIQQLRRLVRFIRENKIDVVHTHCFYTNIFGMTGGFLAGVRARVTSKGETDGFRTPMQKRAERTAFRLCHRVIANCLVVKNQLIREGVSPSKIIQHYNGLDLDRLRVREGLRRENALAEFGLPSDRRYMSIVANLRNPVKDHPMFLRAAARVRAAIPDAGFAIAGEGELVESLRELAGKLQLVYLHDPEHTTFEKAMAPGGPVEVLRQLRGPRVAGFANAILEYMAAGLPVVATDVGGAREAIAEGETGRE